MEFKEKDQKKKAEKQIFALVLPLVICGWIFLLDFIIVSCKIKKMNSKPLKVLKFF